MKQKSKFLGCHSVLDTESMLSFKMDTGFHRYDKKHQGFTLVELVIVIIIVGILSLVAIPIYKKYVQEAKITEAKAFLSAAYNAQRLYYLEHGFYYGMVVGDYRYYDTVLGIDARNNKYFTDFTTATSSLWPAGWVIRTVSNDPNFESVRIHWWADMSKEGTPVDVASITGADSVIPPFFSYLGKDGKEYII